MTPVDNQWVGVVEAHRSGWPHFHAMVWCPDLAEYLRTERRSSTADGRALFFPSEFDAMLRESGWGYLSTVDNVRSEAALNNYLQKLAGGHAQTVGELAKLTQLPTVAPLRFRRLRSGRRFLPPAHSSMGEWTGTLVRHYRDQWGGLDPRSVHTVDARLGRQLADHESHLGAIVTPAVLDVQLARGAEPTPHLSLCDVDEQGECARLAKSAHTRARSRASP